MLKTLKEKNNIPFFSVFDDEFKAFGTVIKDLDTKEIISVAESFEMPKEGSIYHPTIPDFEKLAVANELKINYFGQLDCQVGFCYGYNRLLNVLEWHACNEINIAVTDAVLILAKRSDLDENYKLHSSCCKAVFVPKGTAIEVFSDSLHFCPCQVSDNGFKTVVALPKGTNTQLDFKTSEPKLWAKNKWLISHKENSALLEKGAFPGIDGENIQIKY
ncbi:MAG: DUF4867 family protein [Acutalibacteraceae bacterium]|jgi:hypothetical protein